MISQDVHGLYDIIYNNYGAQMGCDSGIIVRVGKGRQQI